MTENAALPGFYVRRFVRRYMVRRACRILTVRLIRSALVVVLGLCAYAALEHLVMTPPCFRVAFWICASLLAVWPIGAFLFFLHGENFHAKSIGIIGDEKPALREPVSHGFHLWKLDRDSLPLFSKELVQAALESKDRELRALDVNSQVGFRVRPRLKAAAFMIFTLFLLSLALAPDFWKFPLGQICHPLRAAPDRAGLQWAVFPGDTAVFRGEDVRLGLTLYSPRRLENAVLVLCRPGLEDIREPLYARGRGRFEYEFKRVRQTFTYHFVLNDRTTGTFHVAVRDFPEVTSLNLFVRSPAYTGQGERALANGEGDVAALPGSEVRLEIKTNKPVAQAGIRFNHAAARIPMKFGGGIWRGVFRVRQPNEYRLFLEDAEGVANQNSISYRIALEKDEWPLVRITAPGKDKTLTADMQEPLEFSMEDDYGIDRLFLCCQIESDGVKGDADSMTILWNRKPALKQTVSYSWDLTGRDLFPGDIVHYWAALTDNDAVNGPKRARSPVYRFIFPGFREILAEVETKSQENVSALERMRQDQDQLLKKTQELIQEVQQKERPAWDIRKRTQELAEKAEAMGRQTADIQERMRQITDQIQQNQTLHETARQKLQDIRKLMDQLLTPDLQKTFQNMTQKIQNADKDKLREMLENFKISQEEFNRRLDQTLSLLKRMQLEQRLSGLVRQAEEMLNQEKEILDRVAERNSRSCSAESRRQQQMARDMEEMNARADQWSGDMKGLDSTLSMAMDSLSASMPQISRQMRAAAGAMGEGNCSRPQRQQLQQEMLDMMKGLNALQNRFGSREAQALQKEMDRLLDRLLRLSQAQEDLIRTENDHRQALFQTPDFIDEQLLIIKAGVSAADGIFALGRKSMAVNPQALKLLAGSIGRMKQALAGLEQNDLAGAVRPQEEAMRQVNGALLEILKAKNGMPMSGMGGMSMEQFIRQMQGLSAEQMAINQLTMQLFSRQPGGDGMSLEARAQVERLARGQQGIQEALARISEEMGERSSTAGDMENLQKTAEEMAQKLQRQEMDRDLLDRQEQFLGRLLDASKSMRRRGTTRQRHSETALAYSYPGVDRLADDPAMFRMLQEQMMNALRQDFPAEYKTLIRKYFEWLLQKKPAAP